jgi:hypothetical protein
MVRAAALSMSDRMVALATIFRRTHSRQLGEQKHMRRMQQRHP